MSSPTNLNLRHLADTVDQLAVRLSSIQPSSLEQLEEWRETAYRSIDDYCDKKRHELIEMKQVHQRKELDHLRQKVNNLIEKHDDKQDHYDSINHDIQLAEIKINELEHLRLTVHKLPIDGHLIVRRHLFPLPHPCSTIHLKVGLESAVGTNNKHLLVDREGRHLCLLDRNLTVVKETSFTHDGIHGAFWASTIARFIFITFKEILLLDETTMKLETCPIPCKVDWWRGTCSEDILFLSTVEWGSSIYEFNLRSSFKAVKEWHSPVTCKKEEIVCDLKYNSGFLAIPIFNKHKVESRFELRSAATLECIWSVRAHGRCRCCSIDMDQWLLMDHDDCRFFHISADGKLLEADKYDQHEQLEDIIPWGKDDVVVLTKKGINLHKLN
ncbi:unnamed protein product [Rotaria socialis]|uniref:Uncharacterized protein n=1 Tax=Rotaria socialis TaxID=392032 RepID=A0A820UW80_9BILA|nr:unnamed protein product [Rotaria socialis]CAF4491764.1 unnamed protein product [Rotaria socialis]